MNIIDYVKTEFRSFAEHPLGPADSLVLSQLAYIDFSGLVPPLTRKLKTVRFFDCLRSELFSNMLRGTTYPDKNRDLLFAAAASPRFRELGLTAYVSEFDYEEETQFSAISFLLPDRSLYLAYRGTDNTIIGWKEDFHLAFVFPVPAQKRALQYLMHIADVNSGELILGGHSKGGNLAVYAAFSAPEPVRRRLKKVYDHDGPGFKEGALDCEGYREIADRIEKTVPQSALVGMLLEGHKKYTVVKSSRIGLLQHDPFSWKIKDGGFITTEEVSDAARYFNRTLRDWLTTLSPEEREKFTELLFGVLDVGEAKTFAEIDREWKKNYAAIFSAIRETDPEMKEFIGELLRDFGSLLIQNLRPGSRLRLPFFSQKDKPE